MPELPEVETSRLGILPHIQHKMFKQVIIRQSQLRWPVPDCLTNLLPGLRLEDVKRRGKYLLFITKQGCLILHLGMSGNLRISSGIQTIGKHDHIDFVFADDTVLRFNDQRKFGAVLWTSEPLEQHALLANLGPEPLSAAFNSDYLFKCAANRSLPVKSLLMDSHIVVGVGNIYANEALFTAGILPTRPSGAIGFEEFIKLAASIKTVLQQAIEKGGTTLRDFTNAQGKPGYFQQSLQVYGRAGQPCLICGQAAISLLKISQRASYFCPHCQT
jgi:formamidopyrimidine-DNA glycosylase